MSSTPIAAHTSFFTLLETFSLRTYGHTYTHTYVYMSDGFWFLCQKRMHIRLAGEGGEKRPHGVTIELMRYYLEKKNSCVLCAFVPEEQFGNDPLHRSNLEEEDTGDEAGENRSARREHCMYVCMKSAGVYIASIRAYVHNTMRVR